MDRFMHYTQLQPPSNNQVDRTGVNGREKGYVCVTNTTETIKQ
jgi:hypothetical protein